MSSGGGGSSQPANTTSSTTSIPEYARPYVEDMLGKTAALTDTGVNPYQQYTGDRVADFGGLQQQSFTGAGQLPTGALAAQGGTALGQATTAALAPSTFDSAAAQQYMSPYMQNVVDVQKREAARDDAIAQTQRNADAVKAGAFGGSRQAIVESEAARNLAERQGDIQSAGLQSAYDNAQKSYQADQTLRMQGLSTAMQGGTQMGQLGLQGINAQNTLGQQQTQATQAELDAAYGDFQDKLNYPYKQLGFMSDILRGSSGLTQSSSSVYERSPSTVSQLAGLGTAAYGLSKLKKGGRVSLGKPKQRPAGLADLAIQRMG